MIFQSSVQQYTQFWPAFERGMIDRRAIDRAVGRVLRLKFELGLFEHPYVDADAAAPERRVAEHRALALESARASIVLLKNEGGTLPLKKSVASLAVIGADAEEARLGGYSGEGNSKVSILEGIRSKLGARHAGSLCAGAGPVRSRIRARAGRESRHRRPATSARRGSRRSTSTTTGSRASRA